MEVELLIGCGGSDSYQVLTNSECHKICSAVSPRVLGPWARGKEPRPSAKCPKICVKLLKRGPTAVTARMFAWKQPFI